MRIEMKPVRPGYDDIVGTMETVPTGSAQWRRGAVGDTDYFTNWLRPGQGDPDAFQSTFEVSHAVKFTSGVADIHFHYLLSTKPSAGQAFVVDYHYTLVPMGATIPAYASWSIGSHTVTFTGEELPDTHYYVSFVANLPPAPEPTYSALLLVCCERRGEGADTYTGDVGCIHIGAHAKMTQLGSVHVNYD